LLSVFRNIFEKLLQVYSSIFAGQLPVFDGIENIYSKDPLPMIKGKVQYLLLIHILASDTVIVYPGFYNLWELCSKV